MKILSVILNYKTAELTIKSAEAAVNALDYLNDQWKLIIIDNDSQDGSAEKISRALKDKQEKHPEWNQVHFVETGHNGGFGFGNNYAIRSALKSDSPPDYFYILNSDAFPAPTAIRNLSSYLDKHPEVGIVGSNIHGTDGQPHNTNFRFPSILSEIDSALHLGIVSKVLKNHTICLGTLISSQKVDWLAGASMMIRTKVFQEIGLFDETFFLYFEETDLCKRAANKNWETHYVHESKVEHIGSASTGIREISRIPKYWLNSRKYYFQKNHGKTYYFTATILHIILGTLWQIRRKIQKKPNNRPPKFIRDLACHMFKN